MAVLQAHIAVGMLIIKINKSQFLLQYCYLKFIGINDPLISQGAKGSLASMLKIISF
jgi:hypothetical protein